jgi:hypothetical protein
MIKAILAVFSALFFLSGCAVSNIAHKYDPTPSPDIAGYWVGGGMGQTHYLNIKENGTGEICWESMSEYRSTPVVISGDRFITMTEGRLEKKGSNQIRSCYLGACATYNRSSRDRMAGKCLQYFQ